MNADFNVGFMQEHSAAEQAFNRASLREFHGQTVGNGIDRAVERLERSLKGLDAAMVKNELLLEMIRGNESLPDFDEALTKRLVEAEVNRLPRVSKDDREVKTLEDIILVMQSEFATLKELTKQTITETRALQPQIDEGLFVATVLDVSTNFNHSKITMAFGRGDVDRFISIACHTTIQALEDTWPQGFEFLLEAKTGSITPQPTSIELRSIEDVLTLLERTAGLVIANESTPEQARALVAIADAALNTLTAISK